MSRGPQSAVSFGLALAVVASMFLPVGCQRRPLSDEAYKSIMALYSITNRRDEMRLTELERCIDAAESNQTLSHDESVAIRTLIAEARSGEWQSTNQACRVLLERQVSRK